jgi:flagellar hook protein FlgE
MSFQTGLSGLRAATSDLNITANNIANASTTGFKQSRAEFNDVYTASLAESGGRTIGSGVGLSKVAQQFTQGTISNTRRPLDLAINGRGFFVLDNDGARSYTRSGIFGIDKEGVIRSNSGAALVGYAADEEGNIDVGNEKALRIEAFNLPPARTSDVKLSFNLDATKGAPDPVQFPTFDPADQRTFNHASSLTVYDSEGLPHVATLYYRKDQPDPGLETGLNNDWFVWVSIDGTLVNRNPANSGSTPSAVAPLDPNGDDTAFRISFNTDGSLDNTPPAGFTTELVIDDWVPAEQIQAGLGSNAEPDGPNGGSATPVFNGAVDIGFSDFKIDIAGSTQFGDDFNLASLRQDGYGPGQLVGTEVAENGTIFARYTNGQSLVLGQVLLADFPNQQGLTPIGGSEWSESFVSGQPIPGIAGAGAFGLLKSGALEDSNVDLSEELVDLIVAQRNFQANAKTIETNTAITQTVINLRS